MVTVWGFHQTGNGGVVAQKKRCIIWVSRFFLLILQSVIYQYLKPMVKTFLLFMLSACTVLTAKAQFFTLKAGAGFASHYTDSRLVGAYRIGVGYEYELGARWVVEPSLNFSAKGWKDPDQTVFLRDDAGSVLYDEDTGEALTGIKNVSSTAYYITLPVQFGYYIPTSATTYFKVGVGPYIGYGIGGKMKTKGDTDQSGTRRYYYAENTFDEPYTHRIDGGMQAFVGYEFSRNMNAGVEVDFGLLKFNRTARNISFMVTFTYRFRDPLPASSPF